MATQRKVLALLVLVQAATLVLTQGGGGDEGNEGTDVGANPAGALLGCNSPYTYLEANSRGALETFHSLVEGDQDVKAALKYRNLTGTLLMPTNAAFDKLAQTSGIRVLDPGALTTALLQSLLEYHTMFEAIDPTTLAAQQGSMVYDTALSLDAQDVNVKLNAPVWQLFARDEALTYENVTIIAAPLSPGAEPSTGTYVVRGGASEANIIWTGSSQVVRTCLGFIYLIDGVLLPTNNIAALGIGGGATAPLAAAGESEGDSVQGPAIATAG